MEMGSLMVNDKGDWKEAVHVQTLKGHVDLYADACAMPSWRLEMCAGIRSIYRFGRVEI